MVVSARQQKRIMLSMGRYGENVWEEKETMKTMGRTGAQPTFFVKFLSLFPLSFYSFFPSFFFFLYFFSYFFFLFPSIFTLLLRHLGNKNYIVPFLVFSVFVLHLQHCLMGNL